MDNNTSHSDKWSKIDNQEEISSPALLIYPDRIENNIMKMIRIAGGADNLRPHVKTHKMPEIIKLQMNHGIYKFKTATISETEMVASCGAKDILLAMQPVGPNIARFIQLIKKFPATKISCITDSELIIRQLSDIAVQSGCIAGVWLDINIGMNRTGISPGKDAIKLYKMIQNRPNLKAEGLHVYDGHLHETDFSSRKAKCNEAFIPVQTMIYDLANSGTAEIKVVAGGSPTFPIHALRKGVECSPGTTLLWDYKSSSSYPDMNFEHAAVLLTRIISKPGNKLLCIDLGHKALASEMPQPRVILPQLKEYEITGHNEEHMVIMTEDADSFEVGDVLYGIPWHICPTVDRYDTVTIVREQKAAGTWAVAARNRKITI